MHPAIYKALYCTTLTPETLFQPITASCYEDCHYSVVSIRVNLLHLRQQSHAT